MHPATFFKRPALIAALALAGFGATGQAAVVTLAAQNFSLSATQAGNGDSTAAQTLQFAGFNAALGTLTQVRLIRVDDDRYVEAFARGTPSSPEIGARFTDDATASFSLGLGSLALDTPDTLVANAICEDQGATCPVGFLTPTPFQVFTSASVLGATIDLFGASAAAFVSNSLLDIDFGIALNNVIGHSGNINSNTSFGSSQWFGSLAVEYTYDAAPPTGTVPEPSALALVGLALAGLALTRRAAR